jgi:hypothetical protein
MVFFVDSIDAVYAGCVRLSNVRSSVCGDDICDRWTGFNNDAIVRHGYASSQKCAHVFAMLS